MPRRRRPIARRWPRYPTDFALLSNLGLSLGLSGQTGEGITILRELVRDGAATSKTRGNLALVYGLAGRDREASAALSADLSPSQIQNNLAYYRELRGDAAAGQADRQPGPADGARAKAGRAAGGADRARDRRGQAAGRSAATAAAKPPAATCAAAAGSAAQAISTQTLTTAFAPPKPRADAAVGQDAGRCGGAGPGAGKRDPAEDGRPAVAGRVTAPC